MKPVGESSSPDGTRIPQGSTPKELSEYIDTDKELIRLDTGLMLILTDSAYKEMSYQLMNCVRGKQMWDTINLIMEGTEDVQENRLDIMTSQYESFRSLLGESITQVFEKYTKLLNELTMKGKTYPLRETNRKFMMTLPHHVEHKSSSIRERIDFTKIPLEMIYGKLKTYEMKQEQRVIIYGPGTVDNKNSALARSAALVVDEPTTSDIQVQTPKAGKEVTIEAEMDSVNLGVDESDYYTLEELEQMEDKTMAYLATNLSHIRFKRNPKYKFKGSTNRFQKSKYSPGTGFKGGYKTSIIDRSKSRCYNCNELGHFATECRKPRQARDMKDVYEKKDSYEDLKKENAKLKQQLETLSGKQKGKAYIAEGKSWDDTDSDEEEEYVNLALMADSSEESPQSSQTLWNKTAIGFDYIKRTGKKIVEFHVTSSVVKKDTPHILKNVDYLVFVKPVSAPFNEDDLVIRQELLEDDLLKEVEVKTKLPRKSVKTKLPKTDVGNKVSKAKKNRNGKDSVNQNIVSSSPIASRKLCTNYNSTGHLTHSCKKVKVETVVTSEMHNMSDMPDLHEPCGKKECLLCAYNIMHAYFKLMNASSSTDSKNDKSTDSMKVKQVKTDLNVTHVKVSKPSGPKQVWVPKSA
ncbi:hypothetical protein POM88_026731 [Heracleum sosnowskyi]|uniref:CCHC-type domain-containing protein n=1 Tax=Heracleum sosnowskyi TaxID=360622 RepID=A0AAD8I6D9_9APIA|nr:hypothetical protein POM88_026731 [Heracleum sosnowskyi]